MDGSSSDPEQSVTYRSYVLRVWQEGRAGDSWRASLQSATTGERQGFASLDGLFDFIRREAAPARIASPGEDRQPGGEGGDQSGDQLLDFGQPGVTTRRQGSPARREC